VTYRLRRWPLYLVPLNPLVVLRLRLLLQVVGGGLFGSGQRAGGRSTQAAQALKFARSGSEVPGLRRS